MPWWGILIIALAVGLVFAACSLCAAARGN